MRLSDSLILENILVSPFCRLAKRTKEKHLHESADAEKDDNYPIIWRVCDKKYVSRGGYRKSVSFTVILPIAEAIA